LLLASVAGAFGTQITHDWPSSSGDWVIRLVLGEVVRGIVIEWLLKLRLEFLVGTDTRKNCGFILDWSWSEGLRGLLH